MQRIKTRTIPPLDELNGVHIQIPSILPSPINIPVLQSELMYHPDQHYVHYLIKHLYEGFHTGINPLPKTSLECKNLLSACRDPETVDLIVQEELQKGYLLGPFTKVPFAVFRINPIGIVEGKYSKKKRLIVDLSAPHNNDGHQSLNELMNKEDYSLYYVTIDHAIKIIQTLGPGSWLCKADITDAFKLIPIHRSM